MHAVFGLAFWESCFIFHKNINSIGKSPSKTDPMSGRMSNERNRLSSQAERLLVTLYLLVSVQRSLERIGTYRPQTRLMGLPCMPINVGWCQGGTWQSYGSPWVASYMTHVSQRKRRPPVPMRSSPPNDTRLTEHLSDKNYDTSYRYTSCFMRLNPMLRTPQLPPTKGAEPP